MVHFWNIPYTVNFFPAIITFSDNVGLINFTDKFEILLAFAFDPFPLTTVFTRKVITL